jgi:hypothetical protein
MLKKIVLAAALTATASFATWNYFPVQEAGKGQAEIGVTDKMQDKWNQLGLFVGARYTIIQNLELGLKLPYTIFTHWDGEDAKADGIGNLPIMVRYQFMPILNAFVDVDLPIGDEEVSPDGLGIYAGVQYSQNFGMVNFGSELGFGLRTEGDDEISPPFDLKIGLEADFAVIEMLTPYVGVDINMWLGEYTHDGDELPGSDASGTIGIAPFLGLNIAINQMFYAGIDARFGIGEDYYGEDMPITLTGKFGVNF